MTTPGLGVNNTNGLTPQAAALTSEQVANFLVGPLTDASLFLSSGVNIVDSANPYRLPTAPELVADQLAYVSEGGLIPTVTMQAGKITLLPSTMESCKVMVPYTNELARAADVNVAEMVRSNLVDSTAQWVDDKLISGAGDAVHEIRGLLNIPGAQSTAIGGTLSIDAVFDAVTLAKKTFVRQQELQLWVTADLENNLQKQKDDNGQYLLQPDPTQAGRSLIGGVPVVTCQKLPTAAGTGGAADTTTAVLWAPRYVWVVRDAAPTITFSSEARFDHDENVVRVTSRYDVGTPKPQTIIKLTGIELS